MRTLVQPLTYILNQPSSRRLMVKETTTLYNWVSLPEKEKDKSKAMNKIRRMGCEIHPCFVLYWFWTIDFWCWRVPIHVLNRNMWYRNELPFLENSISICPRHKTFTCDSVMRPYQYPIKIIWSFQVELSKSKHRWVMGQLGATLMISNPFT